MSLTIEQVCGHMAALEARIARLEAGSKPEPEVDPGDLDSQYGNFEIRFGLKEKYWSTQPDEHVGRTLSQCPPDYLRATAKYLMACAYIARKEGGEANLKKAGYKEKDAARCLGWAERNERTSPEAGEDLDLCFP